MFWIVGGQIVFSREISLEVFVMCVEIYILVKKSTPSGYRRQSYEHLSPFFLCVKYTVNMLLGCLRMFDMVTGLVGVYYAAGDSICHGNCKGFNSNSDHGLR